MPEKKRFQLGGTEYRLAKSEVEEALQGAQPRPIGKYFVAINGVAFPPKQVISQALGKDLVKFTTMDATRILTALGFQVQRVGERQPPLKNKSELLFEQYLAMSGLSDWDFQKEFVGRTRHPDYSVCLADGREIIFEVKEFRATLEDFQSGGGAYDPYQYIREKINQVSDQFREFKDRCCCLVLFNRDNKPRVDLTWWMVFGAMLGNIGIRIPVNSDAGIGSEQAAVPTFTTGGKMLQYRGFQPVRPQNQTISAILVLDLLPVGRIRFETYVEQLKRERKEELSVEQYMHLIQQLRGTDRDTTLIQLRSVVHENPFARDGFELAQDLFQGPYDERYGLKDGRIQRLFAGEGVRALNPAFIEMYG